MLFLIFSYYKQSCYEHLCVGFYVDNQFSFLWHNCPRVQMLGLMISVVFSFYKNCKSIFKDDCTILYSTPHTITVPDSLYLFILMPFTQFVPWIWNAFPIMEIWLIVQDSDTCLLFYEVSPCPSSWYFFLFCTFKANFLLKYNIHIKHCTNLNCTAW